MGRRIARYIKNLRKGQANESEDEEQLMLELVKEYGTFDQARPGLEGPNPHNGEVVVCNNPVQLQKLSPTPYTSPNSQLTTFLPHSSSQAQPAP